MLGFPGITTKLYLTTLYMTLQEPRSIHPSFLAAPLERSSCRPRINGPLSLIRTIAVLPLYVKCNLVPKGRYLCAAVIPSGLNRSPFAVLFPCIYQEAFIIPFAASTFVVVQPARNGTPTHRVIMRNILFPFCNGASGRSRTHIFLPVTLISVRSGGGY